MENKNLKPRRVTRRELVIDNFHGTPVADPYRWLEDDIAPEVKKWTDEQNSDFDAYISGFDFRAQIKDRLTALWHYEKAGTPQYVEGKYYTWRNNGLQNQNVLYVSSNLDDIGEVVLDPNGLSDDGTVAVINRSFSPTGRFMAYSLSKSGSDWQTIHIMDLETKKDLPDILHHMKFSGMTWLADESGFFYSRFPDPKADDVLKAQARNSMLCLHILGKDQTEDRLIHNDPQNPNHNFRLQADEDKKWAFLYASSGTLFQNTLHFRPLADLDAPWLPIADNFDEGFSVVGVDNDIAYLFTRKDAPNGCIMSVKLSAAGASDWKTVIADQGEVLNFSVMANNHFICNFLHHATSCLKVYNLDGEFVREIKLPAPGTVTMVSAQQRRKEFFIGFSSYLYPATILRGDFDTEGLTTWFASKIDFAFDDYETIQVFYPSKDGTKVPMFITRRKGIKLDGSNPTLLYGYGGYSINMTPGFSASTLAMLERGGIYCVACLRGGNEYGETWHRAGMLESKQNTFDDFIAAGEYLIHEKYTTSKGLAIMGGSNGGLLTGACLTQRPDLFGAVFVRVPVLDMLRFHLFTAGRYWTGEYGCADDPEQFKFLYAYSPLHNVKMNAVYPPTLIMTADTDDRVVPMQARKFAATLQAADGGENPIFIRIEKAAGHGMGKPISKLIDESADLYTFMFANLS